MAIARSTKAPQASLTKACGKVLGSIRNCWPPRPVEHPETELTRIELHHERAFVAISNQDELRRLWSPRRAACHSAFEWVFREGHVERSRSWKSARLRSPSSAVSSSYLANSR
jgi:hypothetical protein